MKNSAPLYGFLISGVLIAATIGKAVRVSDFIASLELRLGSRRRAVAVAAGVFVAEISIGVSIWTPTPRAGMFGLIAFMLLATVWLVTGEAFRREVVLPDCNCFGLSVSWSPIRRFALSAMKPAWWALRNGILVGLALLVIAPAVAVRDAISMGVGATSVVSLAAVTLGVVRLRGSLSSLPEFIPPEAVIDL